MATGGLSHQVHGERAGFNNTAWDHQFLDLFESDPEALLDITHAEYVKRGGFESAEVVMWMVMPLYSVAGGGDASWSGKS